MAATPLYDRLIDRRSGLIGAKSWAGNLRWIAQEAAVPLAFTFCTCPVDQQEAEYAPGAPGSPIPRAKRTLFHLALSNPGAVLRCAYRADSLEVETDDLHFALHMPLHRYGALLVIRSKRKDAARRVVVLDSRAAGRRPVNNAPIAMDVAAGRVAISDGAYTLVFRHGGRATRLSAGGFALTADDAEEIQLAVAFHVDPAQASREADSLLADPDQARAESRGAWEEYLASCPVTRFEQDYTCFNAFAGQSFTYTSEQILTRQLWQWQCALVNVYDIEFNRMRTCMCPDKSIWFGSWSNDGPETLRALAHTSRKPLVRKCLIDYIRHAINARGDLSWYLHGTGVGCLDNPRDSGRLSHGVPAIVDAVAEYVRQSGDGAILAEDAGDGRTVWGKLTLYMQAAFDHRDVNRDGLVEWVNLWEGGADDEVGPFFSRAPLHDWIKALEELPDADLASFYAQHSCPVTNLYEQAFFLRALEGMEFLCGRQGEDALRRMCAQRRAHMLAVIEARHWDELTGFYYDWDVRGSCLARAKNQDAFYLLGHVKDAARIARLVRHLDNPAEFNLHYVPTLARDSAGFRPDGYWCGGYWPRESAYLGKALFQCGCRDRAVGLLVEAICSEQGKVVTENINPLTGVNTTGVTAMAYCALLNVVLAEIVNRQPGGST